MYCLTERSGPRHIPLLTNSPRFRALIFQATEGPGRSNAPVFRIVYKWSPPAPDLWEK